MYLQREPTQQVGSTVRGQGKAHQPHAAAPLCSKGSAMAWFTRFTRFGDVHLVYAQEKGCSCGIASVLMTVFKVNKFVPGHKALHKEKEIYKVYGRVSHTRYDGTSYSYANYLASTLNKLRCGHWVAQDLGSAGVSKAIVNACGKEIVGLGPIVNAVRHRYPIIVLVGWNHGGAHFVVVDTVNDLFGKLYASVCDPWDGDVHITPLQVGHPFHYAGAPVPLSWDLGGTRHTYSHKSRGGANGWVVRRLH
jgi:hypothetical protein